MMKSFAFLLLFPLLLFSFYLYSEQIYRDHFPNPMDLVDLFRQVTHHLFHKLMMHYFLFPFLFFSLKGQLNKITGREPFKTIISKVMIPILEQVVTMLLKLFEVLDPDGDVRLAAINATLQLSIHLGPVLPWSYYYFVLPALEKAINDDDYDVRSIAINAIGQLSTYVGLDVLPILAKAINDPDQNVRLAAIDATVQLSTDVGPDLPSSCHDFVLPALEKAINDAPDRAVRLAAIHATVQLSIHLDRVLPLSYHRLVLSLARVMCEHHDRDVRLAAINAPVQFLIHLRPDFLPLAYRKYMLPYLVLLLNGNVYYPGRDVSLAAINATVQLSIHLRPARPHECPYHSRVLPALFALIKDKPDRDVRLAAINATIQSSIHLHPDLPLSYHNLVLRKLAAEISDSEDPDFQVASAMIDISVKYPQETPRHLKVAVGTLLEKHASFQLEIEELRIREENIAWHEIRISTIEILVMLFEVELPDDTWTSTFNSLSPEQQVEFSSIQKYWG